MNAGEIGLPLGALELAVMETLWQSGPADVKAVYQALTQDTNRSLNTVQSTLERLCRKGVLSRSKHGRAFVYEPLLSREALLVQTMSQIADRLGAHDSGALMASFVELAGREDTANLDRLQQLIDEHRRNDADDE